MQAFSVSPLGDSFLAWTQKEVIVSTKRKETSKIPLIPHKGRMPQMVRNWRAFILAREKLEDPQTNMEATPEVISNKQQAFCRWF